VKVVLQIVFRFRFRGSRIIVSEDWVVKADEVVALASAGSRSGGSISMRPGSTFLISLVAHLDYFCCDCDSISLRHRFLIGFC